MEIYMPYVNKPRPYKKEYENYQGKPEQLKNRAERNTARAAMVKKGAVKKGDGKDVDHVTALSKGGSNATGNLRVSRRIGKDRCKLVKLADCKDFNELFLRDGGAAVTDAIDKAEPYPVQGISSAKDFSARLNDLWNKGTGTGESTGYKSVDQIYTVVPGQLTVVTGYPSSGKSNFVDQIMVNLARDKDWKFALCSFENAPEIHIAAD
jgi:hypothetical protein